MKKIDSFTNCYSLSKTLRFKLIPIGATQSNFDLNKMLDEDKKRAENYSKAKSIIDKYHRFFIEKVLSSVTENKAFDSFLEDVRAYAELYYRSNKDDSDKKEKGKDPVVATGAAPSALIPYALILILAGVVFFISAVRRGKEVSDV